MKVKIQLSILLLLVVGGYFFYFYFTHSDIWTKAISVIISIAIAVLCLFFQEEVLGKNELIGINRLGRWPKKLTIAVTFGSIFLVCLLGFGHSSVWLWGLNGLIAAIAIFISFWRISGIEDRYDFRG
jgi:hypothetical protein